MIDHTVAAMAEADLDSCTALYVDVFNGEPWNDQWTVPTARKRLSDILHSPGFCGCVLRGEAGAPLALVMGNCEQWYDGTQFFYLKEMCVRADLQGQGIGGRLLAHLESRLREQNVSVSFLMTMRGGQTERFYAKNGYEVEEGLVFMSRRLG